jgi:hypothetical protein
MQLAVPKAQALLLSRHRMMLETRFSNSMDMIGKAGSSKFEKIAMQIQWVAVEASLDVVATEAALAVVVVMGAAVDSAAVEATEAVMAGVEEVATAEGEAMLVEAALG